MYNGNGQKEQARCLDELMGAIEACCPTPSFAFLLGIQAMSDHPEWGRSLQQKWNEALLDSMLEKYNVTPIERLSQNVWSVIRLYPAPGFDLNLEALRKMEGKHD